MFNANYASVSIQSEPDKSRQFQRGKALYLLLLHIPHFFTFAMFNANYTSVSIQSDPDQSRQFQRGKALHFLLLSKLTSRWHSLYHEIISFHE
jgi:hypothetical protein